MIEMMSVSQMNTLIGDHFAPALEKYGFHNRKPRSWIRRKQEGMYDLIELTALKGASYTPKWVVSLPYVPHITGERIRWHRTEKTAILLYMNDSKNAILA